MPSREYYLTDRDSKYITAYQRMLGESYVAFGADPDTAADAARDVVDFEIEIANVGSFKYVCFFYVIYYYHYQL
jgi:predicted metalloendopeptidase